MIRRLAILLSAAAFVSGCTANASASAPCLQSSYAGPLVPGTYLLSEGDEVVLIIELLESGRLQHLNFDRVVIDAGYWTATRDTVCLDLDGDAPGREEQCWRSEEPDPSGSFFIERIDSPERYLATPVVKANLGSYAPPPPTQMRTQDAIPPSVRN